jgi:DNA polymerase-3 subunit beta
MELLSKLIDGRFPDYQRVIPSKFTKELLVDRQALLAVLARAAILSNEKFRGVRLSLEPGVLKIASSNTEHEEAQEELEVDYQGETLDVSFNVTYLLDVLQNVSHDHVVLRLNDPSTSALFMLPGTEQFKYVVMPMRI